MSNSEVYGQQYPANNSSKFGAQAFMIQQFLNRMQTTTIVKVVGVKDVGKLAPVGFVDVEPQINQLDGDGKSYPHTTIYNIPYFRLQGGKNAIIIDPEEGDFGYCSFCSRDISDFKEKKEQVDPASSRFYDWADGIYTGGILNGEPEQYIQFNSDGITITSPKDVMINCDNATVKADGNVDVTAKGDITTNSKNAVVNAKVNCEVNAVKNVVVTGKLCQVYTKKVQLSDSGQQLLMNQFAHAYYNGHNHTDSNGKPTTAPIVPMDSSCLTKNTTAG